MMDKRASTTYVPRKFIRKTNENVLILFIEREHYTHFMPQILGGEGRDWGKGGVYLRMDHIDQSFKTNVFEYKLNQYSKRTLGNQKYCA